MCPAVAEKRSIFANAAAVGGLTSAVKLAGAAKVLVTARFFGASDPLDAFLVAFLLPSFFADVFAGSFTLTLVPILVRAQSLKGVAASRQTARMALGLSLAAMSAAAVVLAYTGRWLLPLAGSSFSAPKLHLASALFLGLLFWLPLSACIATWRGVLYAHRLFSLAAAAPLAAPAATIVLLYALAGRWGVTVLCAGTVAGVAIECLLLAGAVRKIGYPLAPSWPAWKSPELSAMRAQYAPLAASAMISSACVLVDQAIAGRLGPGQISALTYGNKLASVLLAIAASAAGTALLPIFSQMAALRDWKGLRRTVIFWGSATILTATPLTILLIAGSSRLVHLMFQHGAFGAAAAQVVADVQRFSLIQAPFAMLLAIVTRVTTALSANALLIPMGMVALAADVALDAFLSQRMGVAGIALATPAVQAISLLTLILLLRRHKPELFRAGA